MSADLALFLTVMSASAFLALVALTVGSSLRQHRLARHAAALAVAVAEEIAHPGDDLMVVADAVAESRMQPWPSGCIWPSCTTGTRLCTPDEPTCEPEPRATGGIVSSGQPFTRDEGETIDPTPTYGQELTYDADGLVQYGTAMVHTRCRDARRDAATDHICEPCGKVFGRVTA